MPDPTPPVPPRRSIRRPLWIAAGTLVGLVALAWIALAIAFPPARVRQVIQQQLGASLAREVRFGKASVGLLPPVRLSVEDVALAEPGGFARGVAFQARAIHLDLDAAALLRRTWVVRRLELDRPSIHLVLKPAGGTNFDSLGARKKPSRPAGPMDFEVEHLEIRDGALLIDDLAARRRIALGLATRTQLASQRSGRFRTAGETHVTRLRFGPLAARADSQMNRSLAVLDWAIEHRAAFDAPSKRLAIEQLAIAFGGTSLTLSGRADLAGAHPVVDLATHGRGVDLGDILGYLSAANARLVSGIRGSGKLDFDLAIRGALAGARRPAAIGTVRVRDAAFTYPGVPVGVERLAFDARLAPDTLVIRALQALVAKQPVRATLHVSRLADPWVRFSLGGRFDLAATSRFVAREDLKLSGDVSLDVRGSGRAKDPGSLALAGWAQLLDVAVSSPNLPKRIERLRGRVEFSQARATIQGLSAQAGKSSFTLDASATRPLALMAKPPAPGVPAIAPSEVDFSLRSPYLDLEELVAPTPGGPLLPNARGGGRVRITRLKQGRLDVANVDAQVTVAPTWIDASSFRFDGYGGSVGGSALIDLADPVKPRIRMSARIDSTQADALLSTWTGAGKVVRGALGGTLDLATDGTTPQEVARSLTATGVAAVSNGQLGPAKLFEALAAFTRIPAFREIKFRDFSTPFRVERGRVATGPSTLVGPYGDWVAAGTIGFDGSLDYAVSVTVPRELVGRLGATGALAAGALADAEGRVLLDLRVKGSAKSPRVSWDAQATKQRLMGKNPLAVIAPVLGPRGAKLDSIVGQAHGDSLRARGEKARKALEDSLKRAARGVLGRIFGGAKRDTTP